MNEVPEHCEHTIDVYFRKQWLGNFRIIAFGTFECTVISADGDNLVEQTVWDRTVDGGFPEAKELKQRVRDIVAPSMDLGHSGDQKKEEAPGTAKSALQRLLSVVRLDRGKRGDKR